MAWRLALFWGVSASPRAQSMPKTITSPWVTATTFPPGWRRRASRKNLTVRATMSRGCSYGGVPVPGVDLCSGPPLEGIEHLDQVRRPPEFERRVERMNLPRGLPRPQQRAAV